MYGANSGASGFLADAVLLSPMYGANVQSQVKANLDALLSPMYGANKSEASLL